MLKQQKNTRTQNALTNLELARRSHENFLVRATNSDLTKAIDYYIRAIKLDPNLSETYYRLASLLWQNGQISLEGAIAQCKAAVEIEYNNPNAHLYTGYFLKMAERFDEAEVEFKNAIKVRPLFSARPRLVLSLLYLQKMSMQKSSKDSKKYKKVSFKAFLQSMYYLFTGSLMIMWDSASLKMLYKNFLADVSTFSYKLMGSMLEGLNEQSLAVKIYDIGAEKTGKHEIFYHRIGDIAFKKKAYEIAVDSYKKVLEENPFNRNVLVKLATIIQTHCENRLDEAIDYYVRLLEIENHNHQIYYELGHLYLRKNDPICAVSAFKLALELDENNPFYHNSLAYSLLKTEQHDEAIYHYNEAISINPDNVWTAIVCQALGAIYHQIKHNHDAAITLYQTSLILDETNLDAHLSLGDLYCDSLDLDNAIKSYCDAIKIDPNNPLAYCKCAMALWEKDFTEEALVAYTKAIELDGDYDIPYNNLGIIYLDDIGNVDVAIGYLKRAVEINPNYTLAHFNLGRAYQARGLTDLSLKSYQSALDLNALTNELEDDDIKSRIFKLFEVSP